MEPCPFWNGNRIGGPCRRGTPAKIRNLLRQCLERDPVRRLQDIGSARLQIESTKQAARTLKPSLVALVGTLLITVCEIEKRNPFPV
jgi:hypothetical protein